MPRFSLNSYKELLISLRKTGRSFCSFSDQTRPCLMLRIDVDYDLNWAARLAEINGQLNILGTFFIQVSSPIYNILSSEGCSLIDRIINCGQEIGLHFHHQGGKLNTERLTREYRILSMIVPSAKKIVAWHNPDSYLARINNEVEKKGFLSTYTDSLFGPERYVSDSNCRNGPEDINHFVTSNRQPVIQVLLHPFNWVMEGDTIEHILKRSFRNKLYRLAHEYSANKVWKKRCGKDILRHYDIKEYEKSA